MQAAAVRERVKSCDLSLENMNVHTCKPFRARTIRVLWAKGQGHATTRWYRPASGLKTGDAGDIRELKLVTESRKLQHQDLTFIAGTKGCQGKCKQYRENFVKLRVLDVNKAHRA